MTDDIGRLRAELRDARSDLLDVRGILSPADGEPVTPLSLVPTVAPAVRWLVDEYWRWRYNITSGRMTCDISKDLRERAGEPLGPLAIEAADKLDGLITSLAAAEKARDTAEAEVTRLGPVSMTAAADRERANDAARLSAAARDEAEELRGQIVSLREQVGIVDQSRMDLVVDLDRAEQKIKKLAAERDQARAEAAETDRALMQVIAERDDRTRVADGLAEAIARLLGVEIGEHSSGNDPWANALAAVAVPGQPTYVELLGTLGQLLEQQDEWRRNIYEQGAELEQLRAQMAWLGGQVTMVRGLAEGVMRMSEPGMEDQASVRAGEIVRIFETPRTDGNAPIEPPAGELEHAFDESSVLNPVTGEPYGPGPLWAGTEPMDYPDPMCVCGVLWDSESNRCSASTPAPVRFRIGRHVATNIYRGDEPMRHACRSEDAQLIVDALNRMETAASTHQPQERSA